LTFDSFISQAKQFFPTVTTYRTLLVLISATVIFLIINALIDLIVPQLARALTALSEKAPNAEKVMQLRRLETLLGIGGAVVRGGVLCIVGYAAWRLIMPATAPLALIGASAFFMILAGNTLGTLLRDVTFGSMMIAERWYNVGDHVTIEPFGASGVVEVLTPRATKLRALTGEAIWLHNQHVMAARVSSRAVRTIALDVFVNEPERGRTMIERAIRALPAGPTMLARQLKISETEQVGEELWRISAVGQTMPGREWLIEDFAIKAITKQDHEEVIVHGPIARNADATAERRFRRTVQAKA
jgi:hypothetical protein